MKLWADLRRRRVFRFTGIYVVGAWLVFQVADVFFPAWGIPESALRYLLNAAVLCFPLALVFSWFFDITSGGIVRTAPAADAEAVDLSLKRGDFLVLAGLLIVAATILYSSLGRIVESADNSTVNVPRTESVQEKPQNSLAILPFENLDPNPETGFFSDGVSEEILNRLAAIPSLKVIGRKSSFAFGGADMGLDQISNILGVRYLLNGSIRRDGDQVRLTARLVDDSGYQLWSESFDGELKGIFKFQSEIAEQVASQITRELVVLKSPEAAQVTENTEAYRYYLIGREYFTRRPPNWAENAAEAFRNSIAADPGYAPPYAGLSIALQMGASPATAEGLLADPQGLVDHALKLDPMLAEGWMAKGLPNQGNPDFDIRAAINNLEYALELNPNLATAYNWLAICLGEINDSEGMIRTRERGLAIDPLHPVLLMNSADIYLARSDFDGWKRQIVRLLDLPEPPRFVYGILSRKHREYGFLPESLRWAKELVLVTQTSQAGQELDRLIVLYEELGMSETADYWFDQLEQHATDPADIKYTRVNILNARGHFDELGPEVDWILDDLSIDLDDPPGEYLVDLGFLFSLLGKYEIAIPFLEHFLKIERPVKDINITSDEIMFTHLLAIDYEQSGLQDKADAMLDRAEHMTRNLFSLGNFLSYPDNQMLPAINLAARGELAGSAVALRKAFDNGWRNYYAERHLPYWRGAWDSPEYAPVVADIVAALDAQRAVVEVFEAENDFRAEFGALLND